MRVTTHGWHLSTVVYRALVVAQTLGWAVSALVRVVARQPRSSLDASPIGIALAIGSVAAIVGGLLTYYVRRTESRDREAVVLAWACFQVGGILALTGYTITSAAICFIVGIITLVVMHAFSPNRFRYSREPED